MRPYTPAVVQWRPDPPRLERQVFTGVSVHFSVNKTAAPAAMVWRAVVPKPLKLLFLSGEMLVDC